MLYLLSFDFALITHSMEPGSLNTYTGFDLLKISNLLLMMMEYDFISVLGGLIGVLDVDMEGYTCVPFYYNGLTLIPAWISNHMPL